jgi:hypothetical protein
MTDLLHDDRLPDILLFFGVTLHKRSCPFNRFAPPIRVEMECSKINVLQLEVSNKVDTVSSSVSPVGWIGRVRIVEESLVASGDHVERIERLDERGHVVDPFGHHLHVAPAWATGKVACGICSTTRLVTELPGEDGWAVGITLHDGLHVILVGSNDLLVVEELRV